MKSIKKATRLVAIGNSLITSVFNELFNKLFLVHEWEVDLKKWCKMILKISSNVLIHKQFFVAFFHVTSD